MKVFPVVILAGGLGTRLGDISKKVPKSMVLLDKKPFLHYQLKYLNLQGVKRVIICSGYLGEQIEEFLVMVQSIILKSFTLLKVIKS